MNDASGNYNRDFYPRSVQPNRVSIVGNTRTKTAFFRSELSDVLARTTSVEELTGKLTQFSNKLLRMNMFDVVDTNIDIESISGDVYDAHIKIRVTEKEVPFIKASTFLRSEETLGCDAGIDLQGAATNPFGHGEIFRLSTATSQTGAKEFISSVSVPNVTADKGQFSLVYKGTEEEKLYFTSFRQQAHTISADYTSCNQAHRISAVCSLRDESPLLDAQPTDQLIASTSTSYSYESIFGTDATPPRKSPLFSPASQRKQPSFPTHSRSNPSSPTLNPLVRKRNSSAHKRLSLPSSMPSITPPMSPPRSPSPPPCRSAGVGLKRDSHVNLRQPIAPSSKAASLLTSIRYLYTAVDTRDSGNSPCSGGLLQGSVEVGAFPGSAQFIRSEVTSQYHCIMTPPLFGQTGVVGSFCGSVGVMYPLQFFLPSMGAYTGGLHSTNRQPDGHRRCYWSYPADRYQLGGSPSPVDYAVVGRAARSSPPLSSSSSSSSSSLSLSPVVSSPFLPPPLQLCEERNKLLHQPLVAADCLGGDAKSSLFFSLSLPVPSLPIPALAGLNMRASLFANVGSLGNSDYWRVATFSSVGKKMESPMLMAQQRRQSIDKDIEITSKNKMVEMKSKRLPLFGYMRAAVGGGLCVCVAESVRLEATCIVPVLGGGDDNSEMARRVRLGIGLCMN